MIFIFMISTIEENMILNFLTSNYPTIRIKHNGRFTRSIRLDDGNVYLLNKTNNNELYTKLLDVLNLVFNTKKLTNQNILKIFLNIK
jgi:hypothetical protein